MIEKLQKISLATRIVLREYLFCHPKKFTTVDVEDLQGACGSGSLLLANVLATFDFTKQVSVQQYYNCVEISGCHCWVRFNNEYFMDITATQFGGPRVFISSKNPYEGMYDTFGMDEGVIIQTSLPMPLMDIETVRGEMIEDMNWPADELLTSSDIHVLTDEALEEYDYVRHVDAMSGVA